MASTSPSLPKTATYLKWLFRLFGSSSLLALIFVFVPYSLMNTIHASMGMGALPDAPVVGYLARSTSAFYTLLGGLMWLVSFDLVRYRPIAKYLGYALMGFGIILFGVDWAEGMPLAWTLWEGPLVTIVGGLVLRLLRDVPAD